MPVSYRKLGKYREVKRIYKIAHQLIFWHFSLFMCVLIIDVNLFFVIYLCCES